MQYNNNIDSSKSRYNTVKNHGNYNLGELAQWLAQHPDKVEALGSIPRCDRLFSVFYYLYHIFRLRVVNIISRNIIKFVVSLSFCYAKVATCPVFALHVS